MKLIFHPLSPLCLLWLLEYHFLLVLLCLQWPLLLKLLSWFIFIFPSSKCKSPLQKVRNTLPSLSTPTAQVTSTRLMTLYIMYILLTPTFVSLVPKSPWNSRPRCLTAYSIPLLGWPTCISNSMSETEPLIPAPLPHQGSSSDNHSRLGIWQLLFVQFLQPSTLRFSLSSSHILHPIHQQPDQLYLQIMSMIQLLLSTAPLS